MPANAPRSSSRILPPALPTSSAGVPITVTVRPASSATLAAAIPAPTAIAAMMLWPQAWPIAGQAIVLGANRDVQRARAGARANAVGRSQMPRSTLKPAPSSDLAEPAACFLFFEAQFRMGVDAMAEIDQRLAVC